MSDNDPIPEQPDPRGPPTAGSVPNGPAGPEGVAPASGGTGGHGRVGQVHLHRVGIALGGRPGPHLPGFFKGVGQIEPLRQLLGGARDILYFHSQWKAGASHAVLVLGLELLFWIILGMAFTTWYDRRDPYRLSPETITTVEHAVLRRSPS